MDLHVLDRGGRGVWVKDLSASLVVFLVALPLCMGIAIASGMPPEKGLVTGIVGGILVGGLSGSPLQVSGPAAGLAVIVFELVRTYGIRALGPVLLLAGVMQLVAGLLKIGRWFRAISPEVIHGMLAGIGVLIVIQQFHVLLDRAPLGNGPANIKAMGSAIFGGLFPLNGSAEESAALIGIVTILVMMGWERFKPEKLRLVPGALLGIIAGTAVAGFGHLGVKHVSVPANLSDMVTPLTKASFTAMSLGSLLAAAGALAFIASAETLLSAAAVEQMQDKVRTNYDKELAAQGFGNIVCAMFGALPMTGVIVRSSANVQAGAESRRSTILHGVWLLLFVAALPWALRLVPTSSLAAVLIVTGLKLLKPKDVKHLRRFGWAPVAIYFASMLTIVMTNLLTGVLVGIGLSLLKLLWTMTRLEAHVDELNETSHLHLSGMGTFLSIPKLSQALDSVPAQRAVHVHTVALRYIDHACIELLEGWVERRRGQGGEVQIELQELQQRFHPSASRQVA